MTEAFKAKMDALIRAERIVVFMKGSQMMPACGFSAKTLQTLKAAGAGKIASHNVLHDPEMREGIKEYSNWPTIPQVYVDGKFLGGCDIVSELHERGELAALVAAKPVA